MNKNYMKKIYLQIISSLLIALVVGILTVDQFRLEEKTVPVSEYLDRMSLQVTEIATTTPPAPTFSDCDFYLAEHNTGFTCYTEKYRKIVASLPTSEVVAEKTGYFEFPLCHKAENELERQACYFEVVAKFKDLAKVEENAKVSYGELVSMCRNFQDEYYRLLCVRSLSLKAVEDGYADLKEMCIENTNTRTERVMCVVEFASKLAGLLYPNKGVEYVKVYTDVCQVLPGNEPRFCEAIIRQSPEKTFRLLPVDVNF